MPRPNGLNRTREQLKDYVLARVRVNKSGCWIWKLKKDKYGYGIGAFRGDGVCKYFKAHRLAFKAFKSKLLKRLELDHLCRVPACCNPDHLEQVTHAENVRRGMAPSMIRARSKTCQVGHPYSVRTSGKRICRICNRAWGKRRRREIKLCKAV